jgi:hypothetical protein
MTEDNSWRFSGKSNNEPRPQGDSDEVSNIKETNRLIRQLINAYETN